MDLKRRRWSVTRRGTMAAKDKAMSLRAETSPGSTVITSKLREDMRVKSGSSISLTIRARTPGRTLTCLGRGKRSDGGQRGVDGEVTIMGRLRVVTIVGIVIGRGRKIFAIHIVGDRSSRGIRGPRGHARPVNITASSRRPSRGTRGVTGSDLLTIVHSGSSLKETKILFKRR
jgi:hypothetical protein